MIERNFNLKIEFMKHPQNPSPFMLKNVTTSLVIEIKHLLVSIGTYSSSFIKFVTVDVRVIIKCSVLAFNGPTPFLVLEMPVKTCEGTVLLTFVLKKLRTLLDSELLQISVNKAKKVSIRIFIDLSSRSSHYILSLLSKV